MAEFPKRFFRRIFGSILEDHYLDVEVRCLHPQRSKDSLWPKQFWANSLRELEKLWFEIEDLNNYGYQIHFTIVARLRKVQGKKEHPLPDKPIVVAVWADLDVGKNKPYKTIKEAVEQVERLKPLPNIIVESGTGIHVYYLLEKPKEVSRKRLERVLLSLSLLLKGDKGAARATRLMRVPNTINWKPEANKQEAAAWYPSKTRHRFKDLEAAWKTSDDGSGRRKANKKKDTKQDQGGDGKYWEFFVQHVSQLVLSDNGSEARGLCPFHDDKDPSFSVNVETGLWKCFGSGCNAEGNVRQFCERLNLPIPEIEIRRFPRLRKIPRDQEWAGEKVFREVHKYIRSQVHFTRDWQPVVVTLWAMGTYLHQQFPCYGHLWLNSPTTQSGKTKLLDVLWTICYKAEEPQLEPTSAVLFRFASAFGGTLLLDEIDNLSPEKRSDVISILNHYHKHGVVFRCVPGKNKKYTVEKFTVYCPKVIAGISNLPDILADRCIKIYLHRKRPADKVERFMPGMYEDTEELRNQIDAWAARDVFQILGACKDYKQLGVPKRADERLRNILEPLFAIAAVLPKWVHDKLDEATVKLARDRRANEEESNPVVLGIQALRENFPEGEDQWRLRSDQAFEIFQHDVPGIETKAHAQALLRRLGLRSTRVRVGKHVLRSYVLSRKTLDRLVEQYGVQQESVA